MVMKWDLGQQKQPIAAETTSLDHITLTGGLSVSSSVAQQMTLEFLKIKLGTFVVSDASNNPSSVSMSDVSADGAVSVTAAKSDRRFGQFHAGGQPLPEVGSQNAGDRGHDEPGQRRARRRTDGQHFRTRWT